MTTIVFTTSRSKLSKLIRWFTKSRCSHVAIGGLDLCGVPILLHATSGGVQTTPRAKWLLTNHVVREVHIIPDVSNGLQRAAERLNERYDYVALLGHGVLIIAWRLFKVWMKNPLASPRKTVCSEFVLELDPKGEVVTEWAGFDPERTNAEELLERTWGASFQSLEESR